ncbi:MAG TPA: GPW/gp25 family protein [Thermomicrobiales bacterium]|nr:GPW/gp25 family protein [Thermomicrobiales bacterium]
MSHDPYGQGASFPLAIAPTGGIQESAGQRKIEESIRIILGTQYGERVMRPTFGCNLKRLLFAPNSLQTANLARHYIEDGLQTWERRIEVMNVTVTNDLVNAALIIAIDYRIRATQDEHSLIYPYYLEQPQP